MGPVKVVVGETLRLKLLDISSRISKTIFYLS